ncbi:hypothetical protein D3C85_1262540 [compost metagenome]
MRSPAKKHGRALGMRRRSNTCQRLARLRRNRLSRPGLTLRRPSTVLAMIGKIATRVAQITNATMVLLHQMMISGATATTGVTCNRMA